MKMMQRFKSLLIIVNVLAVLYNASLVLYATTYIVEQGMSHFLLENLATRPVNPIFLFWSSILSFTSLLMVMLWRTHLKKESEHWIPWLISLELVLMLMTFSFLQSTYNGLFLLVFIDIFFSYTDFYVLRQRRYWIVFLVLSFSALLLSQYDLLSLVINTPSLDSYLMFFPKSVQLFTLFIKNLLTSLNMFFFISSLISYIIYSVTENHKIEEELMLAAQSNRELIAYVAVTEKVAEKRERKRIAREIHDTLGHALTGISAGIDAVTVLIDLDRDRAKEQLKAVSNVVREGIRDVQRSLEKMRPGALEDNNLKIAIENMIENYEELSDLQVTLDYGWDDVDFEVTTEDILFRVIQESVTNSLRHGHAKHVAISCYTDDYHHLTIQDDGIGSDKIEYGYGLKQMQERLAIIGGHAEFSSDEGFKTEVIIPK